MTHNEIQKLFDTTLIKANIKELTAKQSDTFLLACKRVYLDNPDNNFSDHLIAANIYLKQILIFPDITLPTDDIQLPIK